MTFPLMPQFIASVLNKTAGSIALSNGGSFVVPEYVTSVSVTLSGAKGGGGGGNTQLGGPGGRGARVYQAALAVTPGETLTVSGGVGGAAGVNQTGNSTQGGQPGSQLLLRRGATTLMSANGGQGGARAVRSDGDDYPGAQSPSGSGVGTGGTVTTGGGTSLGGTGGRNSPFLAPTAGGNGSVTISWT